MSGLFLSLLLAQGGVFLEHFGSHGAMGKVMGGLADRVITLKITSDDETGSDSESDIDPEADEGSDLEVLPPVPPVPLVPRVPPVPPVRMNRLDAQRELPHFAERRRNGPTAELLHRNERTTVLTMT